MKKLLLIICAFWFTLIKSQTSPKVLLSQDGKFEKVMDKDGKEYAPVFNPPNQVCGNTIINLQQYASVTGTFTGATPNASACITVTNGSYYFNFTPSLTTGYYPVAFTYTMANGCTYTLTQSIYYQTGCCTSPGIPLFTATIVPTYTSVSGPMRIVNDFTIQPGAVCVLQPGEFIMGSPSNSSITITVEGELDIIGAHLYTCGSDLWKGIVIKNGGKVVTLPASGGNACLIEDAVTAFEIPNFTGTVTPLYLNNTIFNKNYIGISINNIPLANYSQPLLLNNCVFTCRDFSFTSSSWPGVSTTSLGLRYSATNTAVPLASPFALQSATITNLKNPYSNQRSHIAININNVGLTYGNGASPLTFYHLDLTPLNDFTLFDAHEYFIKSVNSNVKISNSVFQNTQTFSVINTPTVGAAIDYSCSNISSYTPNSTIANYELVMSGAATSTANKFFDCHRAINGNNPFSFKIENASFRSTHQASVATSTSVISTGRSAIFMRTNQVEDYIIKNNEFSNITDGVAISLYPANVMRPGMSYYAGPPQLFAINAYIHTLTVIGNTFSPSGSNSYTGTLSGYVKNAINISSDPYNLTLPYCGCYGIHVEFNTLYRVLNGITLNAVNPYTITCKNVGVKKIISGNKIILEEDNVFGGITQRGIEYVNSISEPVQNGQRLQMVENNTLSVFGGTVAQNNPNISLYYGSYNGGTGTLFPTPHILCNDLRNANKGFVFENENIPASWRGNRMEDLKKAMLLTGTSTNGGVIGQQGNASNPSDNIWSTATNWSGSYSGTWVDLGSDAKKSPLFLRSNTGQWFPQNNLGTAFTPEQYNTLNNTLKISTSGSYSCGAEGNYTLMNSPAPGSGTITNVAWYISATFSYRYLAINDSMKNADGDLLEFYNDLSGTSIDDFMQIEMKINERKFSDAQSILDAMSTSGFNSVESTYFTFYTLSLKYKIGDDEFTFDDLDALKMIAGLCPGSYGGVVYHARALYQLITEQVFNGTDGCAESGARMAQPGKYLPEKNFEQWDVNLFPNPNNGNFMIISKNEKEILEVILNDVSGKELYRKRIQTSKHYYMLDLTLLNGVYFVTVKNQENESVTKKMGIAK